MEVKKQRKTLKGRLRIGEKFRDINARSVEKGFKECWRVLEDYGVLIFKWNEARIKKSEVLEVLNKEPLFGHSPLGNHKSHWLCFMKIPKSTQKTSSEDSDGKR